VGAEKLSRDLDFHAWLLSQAKVLRDRSHPHVDWAELAEELQAMAGREERGLESQFERLLTHLLKWAYQPGHRGGGWQASIDNARDKIEERIEHSPSLAPKLGKLIEVAYRRARRTAGAEMGLDKLQWERLFPEPCPWSAELLRNPSFMPAAAPCANGHKR
jgi:hypothetical protein